MSVDRFTRDEIWSLLIVRSEEMIDYIRNKEWGDFRKSTDGISARLKRLEVMRDVLRQLDGEWQVP